MKSIFGVEEGESLKLSSGVCAHTISKLGKQKVNEGTSVKAAQ
jgi:hypothetical protein